MRGIGIIDDNRSIMADLAMALHRPRINIVLVDDHSQLPPINEVTMVLSNMESRIPQLVDASGFYAFASAKERHLKNQPFYKSLPKYNRRRK